MGSKLAFLRCDTAVDLGTANTFIHLRGRGLVLKQPSVVAINSRSGRIIAVGAAAKQMIGRVPETITMVHPVRGGVITDFEFATRMIRHFLRAASRPPNFIKRHVVVAVPSGITAVQRRAVQEATHLAGARRVHVIEAPIAAAIGMGLVGPESESDGTMVVNVGGGTTDAAIISMGGIVVAHALQVGGDNLDQAIVSYARREHGLVVGLAAAEETKIAAGSACPSAKERSTSLRGRHAMTGLPKVVSVSQTEICAAIAEPVGAIVDLVKKTLSECPPEVSGDLMDQGMVLTGGGALLDGLEDLLRAEIGIPTHLVDNPLDSVVLGSAKYAEELASE
jgi:rod shape-determining protein MreB and related proteins